LGGSSFEEILGSQQKNKIWKRESQGDSEPPSREKKENKRNTGGGGGIGRERREKGGGGGVSFRGTADKSGLVRRKGEGGAKTGGTDHKERNNGVVKQDNHPLAGLKTQQDVVKAGLSQKIARSPRSYLDIPLPKGVLLLSWGKKCRLERKSL